MAMGAPSCGKDSLTRRNAALSVQVDWLGSLPAAHLNAFRMYAEESESNYSMFSVTLNEAITLRDIGLRTESFQMVGLACDLCDRLTRHLDRMFTSMATHCKENGTKPSVASLDTECFCRPGTRRLLSLNRFLIGPLSSRHERFLCKLSTLRKIAALASADFHKAATNLLAMNVALAAARDSSWDAMDAVHYDL